MNTIHRNDVPYVGTVHTTLLLLARAQGSEDQAEPEYGPARRHLIIIGGSDSRGIGIMETFVDLAGGLGASIVVVSTGGGNVADDGSVKQYQEDEDVGPWKCGLGLGHLTVLHTHDPQVANTEEFLKPLREADGVWFNGGRNWPLVDSYAGTLTERESHRVLERDAVIGRSSAGATIRDDFLVRGAVAGPEIFMPPEPEHLHGFRFMRRSATDQHLNRHNRLDDLVPVVQKIPGPAGNRFERRHRHRRSWRSIRSVGHEGGVP